MTIARVQCISLVEQQAPSRVDGMALAKTETEAREWQRVRLHVSRGDVLTIAQCQSPLNQCRFPFLLDFGNTHGTGTDSSSLALPLVRIFYIMGCECEETEQRGGEGLGCEFSQNFTFKYIKNFTAQFGKSLLGFRVVGWGLGDSVGEKFTRKFSRVLLGAAGKLF